MNRLVHSVQTKLTLSFIVLILFVAGGTFLFTFSATKSALKHILQNELQAIASTVASRLDGDPLEHLKAGMENTAEFKDAIVQLRKIRRAHPDIKYIYTFRKVGKEVRFIVDADYGNANDPGGAIDEKYPKVTPDILEGFEHPTASKEFYSDKWGTFLSGFAPIRNHEGKIVGVIGVDMLSTLVIERQNFIGNTIYFIMGAGILLAALFVLLFLKTIIRDINKLNHVAEEVSMGNMELKVDVRRKDEIGDLAESFSRMVASLKIMMMMGHEEPESTEPKSDAAE